jgi:hypothetical protein
MLKTEHLYVPIETWVYLCQKTEQFLSLSNSTMGLIMPSSHCREGESWDFNSALVINSTINLLISRPAAITLLSY